MEEIEREKGEEKREEGPAIPMEGIKNEHRLKERKKNQKKKEEEEDQRETRGPAQFVSILNGGRCRWGSDRPLSGPLGNPRRPKLKIES